ncbi:MAG TPA: hypothetical protein VL463_07555 [Kofleriaceae bacterium]|jgi:hypothetical protein|nr:hypothetical protein [Kofleriaceae bacterium]
MMTNTNRLDEIAQRTRTSRSRDLAFAILIAFIVIFQVTALRAAVAKTQRPVAAAPSAHVQQLDDGSANSCSATPVC